MKAWLSKYTELPRILESLTASSPDTSTHRYLTQAIVDLAVILTDWTVRKRGYHLQNLGMSVRDVAYDAVAELLFDDPAETCSTLTKALKSLGNEECSADILLARLKTIVLGTINKNLVRIFAEFDPTYAKMLRMLRIYVRNSGSISVKPSISGHWYHREPEEQACFHLPALTAEDLKTRIRLPEMDGNPTAVVLEACLLTLEEQSEYRRAVHESDVMKITLELIGSGYHAVSHAAEDAREYHDHNQMLDAVETAIHDTRDWAMVKYVKKNKLAIPELEAMFRAIRAFIRDSAEGDPESHFFYVHQQLPGLTYERFRTDYRNTFQYILRQFFTNAKGLLVSLGYETHE